MTTEGPIAARIIDFLKRLRGERTVEELTADFDRWRYSPDFNESYLAAISLEAAELLTEIDLAAITSFRARPEPEYARFDHVLSWEVAPELGRWRWTVYAGPERAIVRTGTKRRRPKAEAQALDVHLIAERMLELEAER